MIPELGHFALCIALGLAVVQMIAPLVARRATTTLTAAYLQCLFVCLGFAALTYCFAQHDFSVAYVAANSNSGLPLPYRISAVWGAHEGSLLLWILILSWWTVAVGVFSRALGHDIRDLVIAVMGAVSVAFLVFLLATSNPFARLHPAAPDGADLNPLLQDPGLIFHPPILYAGYVGTIVAFAFAIAALIRGQLTSAWARWVRPWTTAAWVLLTLGIALGSWWAYYELGWGGWWFWDPVENASFMPWLLGTALIHALAVTEKRGTFKNWTVLLAIGTFALSLLGTFLVRSGVLTSVHAFATDPARGVFILTILALVIGGSLTLYAWRGPKTYAGNHYEVVSRESFLLINSLLLAVTTATVLLGTLYPLCLEALDLGKISVGPPYFDLAFSILMIPVVIALGLGQFARWRGDNFARLWRLVRPALWASLLLAGCSALMVSGSRATIAIGVALATWIGISTLLGLIESVRERPHPWRALRQLPRALIGQCIAHWGLACTLLGVVLTNALSSDLHTRLGPGDTASVGAYEFRFVSISELDGPNYVATEAVFDVSRAGKPVAKLRPQKRLYKVRQMPMTEAGIAAGLRRDLYVSLGERLSGDVWSVRIHSKDFVRLIWLGALGMALGGVIATTDRRYRLVPRQALDNTKVRGELA